MFLVHITNPKSFVFNFWGSLQYERAVPFALHQRWLTLVGSVIRLAAYLPQVGLHGLLATGKIFLRQEVLLVLRDLREVTLAVLDHQRYGCEALTSLQLIAGRLGRAEELAYHVDAGAVRVLGGCYSVGSQERVAVRAVRLSSFGAARQKAGNEVNTFCPLNFCHIVCGQHNSWPLGGKNE